MLDDEQQLVVQRRIAQGLLRREQGIELQVTAITEAIAQVGGDALLQRALVFLRGHVVPWQRGRGHAPRYGSRAMRALPAKS